MYFAFQHAHLGTADTFGKNVNHCDIYIVDRLRKDKRRVGQALLTDTLECSPFRRTSRLD